MKGRTFAVTHVAAAAAITLLLSACGPSKEERARQAEVDSIAAAKARGETDLSNPEMGSKVLITLTADSIEQSHAELPVGQVTFAVQNHGNAERVFEIEGRSGDWKTMPIPPHGSVLMAMVMQPGDYDMFCTDSAGKSRDVCGPTKKIRLVGEMPSQVVPTDTTK